MQYIIESEQQDEVALSAALLFVLFLKMKNKTNNRAADKARMRRVRPGVDWHQGTTPWLGSPQSPKRC